MRLGLFGPNRPSVRSFHVGFVWPRWKVEAFRTLRWVRLAKIRTYFPLVWVSAKRSAYPRWVRSAKRSAYPRWVRSAKLSTDPRLGSFGQSGRRHRWVRSAKRSARPHWVRSADQWTFSSWLRFGRASTLFLTASFGQNTGRCRLAWFGQLPANVATHDRSVRSAHEGALIPTAADFPSSCRPNDIASCAPMSGRVRSMRTFRG